MEIIACNGATYAVTDVDGEITITLAGIKTEIEFRTLLRMAVAIKRTGRVAYREPSTNVYYYVLEDLGSSVAAYAAEFIDDSTLAGYAYWGHEPGTLDFTFGRPAEMSPVPFDWAVSAVQAFAWTAWKTFGDGSLRAEDYFQQEIGQ